MMGVGVLLYPTIEQLSQSLIHLTISSLIILLQKIFVDDMKRIGELLGHDSCEK